jgi:hypothetical protein
MLFYMALAGARLQSHEQRVLPPQRPRRPAPRASRRDHRERRPTTHGSAATCAEPLVEAPLIRSVYPGQVLELGDLDLDEVASALADQTDYEHRWLINPQTGEIRRSRYECGSSWADVGSFVGSRRVIGPQASMTRARAASALWKPRARRMMRRTAELRPSARAFDRAVECTAR